MMLLVLGTVIKFGAIGPYEVPYTLYVDAVLGGMHEWTFIQFRLRNNQTRNHPRKNRKEINHDLNGQKIPHTRRA